MQAFFNSIDQRKIFDKLKKCIEEPSIEPRA